MYLQYLSICILFIADIQCATSQTVSKNEKTSSTNAPTETLEKQSEKKSTHYAAKSKVPKSNKALSQTITLDKQDDLTIENFDHGILRGCNHITVKDQASIDGYSVKKVLFQDSSRGIIYPESTIMTKNKASVRIFDSTVKAHDESQVLASGESKVYGFQKTKIGLRGNSKAVVFDNADVDATEKSTVIAFDKASVRAQGSAKVQAYNETTVYLHDNSNVVLHDKATGILKSATATYKTVGDNVKIVQGDGKTAESSEKKKDDKDSAENNTHEEKDDDIPTDDIANIDGKNENSKSKKNGDEMDVISAKSEDDSEGLYDRIKGTDDSDVGSSAPSMVSKYSVAAFAIFGIIISLATQML